MSTFGLIGKPTAVHASMISSADLALVVEGALSTKRACSCLKFEAQLFVGGLISTTLVVLPSVILFVYLMPVKVLATMSLGVFALSFAFVGRWTILTVSSVGANSVTFSITFASWVWLLSP